MEFQTAVLLGTIAMVTWGISDLFAKNAISRIGVIRTLFSLKSLSLLFIIFLLYWNKTNITFPDSFNIILFATILDIIGFYLYYKAIQIGKISVVSPITSSTGMIPVILGILILSEILSLMQAISIIIILIGIFLISTKISELKKIQLLKEKGSFLALGAMFAWGFVLFLLALISKSIQPIQLIFWFLLIQVLIFSIFFSVKKNINLFNIKKIKKNLNNLYNDVMEILKSDLLHHKWRSLRRFSETDFQDTKKAEAINNHGIHLHPKGMELSAFFRVTNFNKPFQNIWLLLIIITTLELIGFFAYTNGVSKNLVSIVAPIATAGPLVTIIFARIFYKEKLEINQLFGALLIISGIVSLAI